MAETKEFTREKKVEFEGAKDPITFAVIYNRLLTINREMGITMVNTSISPIFAETHDFSCAICDWDCRIVSQVDGVPSHTASAMESVKAIVDYFGDDINDGDIFVLNDPYMGGTHLQDVTIMKPVFYNGRIQFISINRAHHGDVGGMEPGSYCPNATELYHEGVRIPPLRIYKNNEPIMDVINMIRHNTRMVDDIWVDMKAQVASCNVGEKRIIEMMEKYGEEKTRETIEDIHLYAESRMRAEIEKLPDGDYFGEAHLDGDGFSDEPIDIKVKITIKGDTAYVDFDGSSPQVTGPSNSPKANTDTCVYVAFLTTVTTPDIPHNEGVYRPIVITAPEGSVVNSNFPAPVAYCTLDTACAILEACWMALSDILPDRVPAGWNRWNGPTITGIDSRSGDFYVMFGFNGFGGAGGAKGMDGRHYIGDGIDLGGLIAPNIETTEVDYPILTTFNEFTTDSCGDGEYRGGCGAGYQIRFYEDAETDIVMFGDGRKFPPYGLFGGGEGTVNMAYLNEGEEGEQLLDSKGVSHVSGPQTFTSYPSGGGGWGDPKKRDAKVVAMDARNEIISVKAAREIYGVALNDDFTVNEEETKKLRA